MPDLRYGDSAWDRTWTPALVADEARNLARQIAEGHPMTDTTPERPDPSAAPVGTLAGAYGGGAWLRVERGWQWNGHTRSPGSTFPRLGGDWNGTLIPPSDPEATR